MAAAAIGDKLQNQIRKNPGHATVRFCFGVPVWPPQRAADNTSGVGGFFGNPFGRH